MSKGAEITINEKGHPKQNGVLDSVICRFLFIYVDGDYKLIKYVEANNQDEAERKADNGWVRVVELEEDMQIVYNGI